MPRGGYSEASRICLANIAHVLKPDGFDRGDLAIANRSRLGALVCASLVKKTPPGSRREYIVTREGRFYMSLQRLGE